MLWALAAALFVLSWMAGTLLATPLASSLQGHEPMGLGMLVASSALAVVLPALSNLALVPAAVLLYGPPTVAAALLAGWVLGSWLAFVLGRLVRQGWLGAAPGLKRAIDIDRLIHPEHRLWSLVWLRLSFPLDVLSLSLGIFSARTTAGEVILSTLLGAAPFALLFAWFPALSLRWQAGLLLASVLAFGIYVVWIRRSLRSAPQRA